jgi:acetolactate synthase I/II/III large subunit
LLVGSARRLLELSSSRSDRPLHDPQILDTLADRDVFGPYDESGEDGIDPRVLTVALDRLLPKDRTVITDGGHHLGFGASALRVPESGRARLTAEFAAVGIGLGSACGAAIGRPELTTILFIGDGGLTMTMGDLQTVVREQQPIVIVVMNDRAYGAEVHFLDLEGLPYEYAQFEDVDFAAVARALGITAFTVRHLGDLEAHSSLLAQPDGPLLIDCKINPRVRAQWLVDLYAARRPAAETAEAPA